MRTLTVMASLVALSTSPTLTTLAQAQQAPEPAPPAPEPAPPAPEPAPPAPEPAPPAPEPAPAPGAAGDSGDDDDFFADGGEGDDVAPADDAAPSDEGPPEDGSTPVDDATGSVEDDFFSEDLEESDPTSEPIPDGKGILWGSVTDSVTGQPLLEAPVTVVGREIQVYSDFDGRFRIELPPGAYDVRAFYEGHEPLRLQGVQVIGGQATEQDFQLAPTGEVTDFDVIEVEAQVEKATLEGQILSRQRAPAVNDSIGRGEISKSPDSDAAQAAQRVVGASIVGGRFVYVRGLGERYTNGLLNGAPLPSPEPDRAAVPLDLFPALVLEAVSISKTFTPDMPADFAGGSVNVQTRGIPTTTLLNVSVGLGANTQTTFTHRLDHPGSSTDWLGYDSGLRSMPSSVPGDYVLAPSARRPDGEFVAPEELVRVGRDVNTTMTPIESYSLPNHSASIVMGRGWGLGAERKIGVVASLNYSHGYKKRDEIIRDYRPNTNDPKGYETIIDYRRNVGSEAVRWGAYASLAYSFNDDHTVRLVGLHSQLADDTTSVFSGHSNYRDVDIVSNRMQYVQRALDYASLSGEHTFEALQDAELDWNLGLSKATRYEPDTRDVVYNQASPDLPYSVVDGSASGSHFWSEQDEVAKTGSLDWLQPFDAAGRAANVKLGTLLSQKDRQFTARRFALRPITPYRAQHQCPAQWDPTCPDDLYVDSNVGSRNDRTKFLHFAEYTRESDAYDAELDVYAGYMMADAEVLDGVRVIAGERVEVTRQIIEPNDYLDLPGDVESARLTSTDVLPSAALVFSATEKAKFRASVTRTLARPQLRELAPFTYTNYFGGRDEQGNPDLTLTRITNYDLRFEYFPTLREVLAMSVFAKTFEDPIEPVLTPGSEQGILTFRNAKGARLLGLELEARQSLATLADELKDFTVVSNLTLAHSRIQVDQTGRNFLTNTARPLVNQAPWVLNVALDYAHEPLGLSARALYNVTGVRLVEVGTEGLDDRYLQPRHLIDFVVSKGFGEHWKVKLTVEDILNAPYLVTQGSGRSGPIATRYTTGTDVSVGASYTY